MVTVSREKALVIENYLKGIKAAFMWYLASSLEVDTIMMAFHLEGMCFKESNTRYFELTSGIDKALTIMIQYQNELGDDFRLLVPTKTKQEYDDLLGRLVKYADA